MGVQQLVWSSVLVNMLLHTVQLQPHIAAMAQGPVEVNGLLTNLKTWSLSVLTGVVAIVFIWKLLGHIKDSPIEWKAVIGDLFAIAFMAAVAFNSEAVMEYVRNNITFNSR